MAALLDEAGLGALQQQHQARTRRLVAHGGATDGWAALTWPPEVDPRRLRRGLDRLLGRRTDGRWHRLLADRSEVLDLTTPPMAPPLPGIALHQRSEVAPIL